jgi:hypothetical protein
VLDLSVSQLPLLDALEDFHSVPAGTLLQFVLSTAAPETQRTSRDPVKRSCRNIVPLSLSESSTTLDGSIHYHRQCSCRNTRSIFGSRRAIFSETVPAETLCEYSSRPAGVATRGQAQPDSVGAPAGTLHSDSQPASRDLSLRCSCRNIWTCFTHNSLTCTAILHCI